MILSASFLKYVWLIIILLSVAICGVTTPYIYILSPFGFHHIFLLRNPVRYVWRLGKSENQDHLLVAKPRLAPRNLNSWPWGLSTLPRPRAASWNDLVCLRTGLSLQDFLFLTEKLGIVGAGFLKPSLSYEHPVIASKLLCMFFLHRFYLPTKKSPTYFTSCHGGGSPAAVSTYFRAFVLTV